MVCGREYHTLVTFGLQEQARRHRRASHGPPLSSTSAQSSPVPARQLLLEVSSTPAHPPCYLAASLLPTDPGTDLSPHWAENKQTRKTKA